MVVGLTGGIGSGKSTVADMFHNLGVPVYIADKEAKKLMERSDDIRNKIVELLGEQAYDGYLPERSYIANIVFKDKHKLSALNAIIHPAVKKHFHEWYKAQKSPYVIKEVAILFETGGANECDYTILVTAPEEDRIKRVIIRDQVDREVVLERMNNQWPDNKKIELADFVINNTNLVKTQQQVTTIHNTLLAKRK
ncbi:dephospho-CoA kinase [Zhouia amylolytica]|uniref:Dephospho-CoA kinase n=1 Tax=Zhouia amylolytica TaxID=376730 RepID=A0A1I6QXM9_9FLAO|nr:dephospho-CoA kinase [Zhouia amylolytica]MCQ0110829.1 dephospho-CoA kinase [Zhouia amylolytica]SFS57155.1 dephospho-CoA kinase [Zhouia amylolytica]